MTKKPKQTIYHPTIDFAYWCSVINYLDNSANANRWGLGCTNIPWTSVVSKIHKTLDMRCIMEQLLCEGYLPLVCDKCGHLLNNHLFDGNPMYGSICLNCPCKEFSGHWIERGYFD